MKEFSFYSEADGLFSSRRFVSSAHEAVKLNTPSGYRAIEGRFDHLSQRVDLATGQVIHDPEMAAANRLRVEKEKASSSALRQIRELEESQLRPLRELARDPNDAAALTRLRAIDDRIRGLRAQL